MSSQMAEQLIEAGMLMAVGMSVVFAFLTILIAGVHSIAWFCRAFPSKHDEIAASVRSAKKQPINNNKRPTTVSPQIAAAIAAAVHTHRQTTIK
ncbi:MAG: oxaloacetate decarboxylase gamma subunit [Glaciecola sp.]|jgi:oxaloacetate decarboxylase gamma subunit